MPSWTAPLDVSFNYASNAAAAAQVEVTIGFLEVLLDAEQDSLAAARHGWRGAVKQSTQRRLGAHFASLRNLDQQLRSLLVDLADASDDAMAEDRRRDDLQQQWLRERQTEELERLDAGGAASGSGPR